MSYYKCSELRDRTNRTKEKLKTLIKSAASGEVKETYDITS